MIRRLKAVAGQVKVPTNDFHWITDGYIGLPILCQFFASLYVAGSFQSGLFLDVSQ